MHLLVYTPVITARIAYTWEVILKYVLRLEYSLTDDAHVYREAAAYKINYSNQRLFSAEVLLPLGKLLLESGIRPPTLNVFPCEGLPAFFEIDTPTSDLPFDLPAMVFYLISRYEEYLPFEPDRHGRFTAKQSLAFQANFLRQPLVNEWILKFYTLLQKKYPDLPIFQPSTIAAFQPTYDIDLAWAYRHKGWKRTIGAYLKDCLTGNFKTIASRWQVQTGKAADPFFTFNHLDELHKRYDLKPTYFFLLGDYGRFDTNISHQNKAFRRLIKALYQKYPLGIHPSYGSHKNLTQLQTEIMRLEQITGKPIVRSRQHFLKLQFPVTYQALLQSGITADYSLGYADDIGFRASIATPYPWYDLSTEKMTTLLLFPFEVMDVTLKNYLQFHPAQAIEEVRLMIQKTKAVGGTFCILWHNSSFSNVDNWKGWKEVYEEIIKLGSGR